jgi:hypothetical protein
MPAFFRPIKAIKSPIPTAMANFRPSGMAFMTASRRFVRTRMVTRRPSTITAAIAVCQGSCWPRIRVKATTALSPRPEARATGKFATTPIAMLAAAAAMHVAKNTPGTERPVPSVPRIAGLTKIMYAIVIKVVSPAITSVRRFVPRSENLKKPPKTGVLSAESV